MTTRGNPNGTRWRRRLLMPAVLLMLGMGLVSAAAAQSTTVGSISGTIKDSSSLH